MIDLSLELIRQTQATRRSDGGWRRRDFLRWLPPLAVAAGGLTWNDWLLAQAPQLRQQGKHCILLWMRGGPSQFETFAPLDRHANAGETSSIATNVAGIRIAHTLPRTAKAMDDICLIRSMTSKEGSHPRATFLMQTGYLPNPSVRHPSFGAITAERLGDVAQQLPSFVRIGGRANLAGPGAGLLGVEYAPFVMRDPSRPPENTTPTTAVDRFQRRLEMVERMDRQYRRAGARQEATDHTKLYQEAASMMLSSDMQAFDIEAEPTSLREAYGEGEFAQGCLLARRLVEAGVTFVEVELGNWDTHRDNFSETTRLCQQMDQPYATLLADLKSRGMLDKTLVIWMGEFGRTPRINARGGRDHFPNAFSVALAGGGVRGGQVIGEVDRSGNEVIKRPVTVQDLFQTFCHLLAIDPAHENIGNAGRPLKIVDGGTAVAEVWS